MCVCVCTVCVKKAKYAYWFQNIHLYIFIYILYTHTQLQNYMTMAHPLLYVRQTQTDQMKITELKSRSSVTQSLPSVSKWSSISPFTFKLECTSRVLCINKFLESPWQ